MSAISTSNCKIVKLHRPDDNIEVDSQLDQLLTKMHRLGFTDDVIVEAVFGWAAKRAYHTGGYPAARRLMLEFPRQPAPAAEPALAGKEA